jgi:hypothetical protein
MLEPRFGQAHRQVLPHLKGVRWRISTRTQTQFTYTAAYPERQQARELIGERTHRHRPSPLRRRNRLRYHRQQRHRSTLRSPHPRSPPKLRRSRRLHLRQLRRLQHRSPHAQSPPKLHRSQRLHLRRLRRSRLRSRHHPSQLKLRQSKQLHLRPRFGPWLLKPWLHPRRKPPIRQRYAWNRPLVRFQCHQRNHHQRQSRAAHPRFQ